MLILFLAACNAPLSTGPLAFRDPKAPIFSSAAFDPAALQGRWLQVADFGGPKSPDCASGAVDFSASASGLVVKGTICLDGRRHSISGLVGKAGPGRLAVAGMEDWWIVWVDSGYRTLAVGTPSGRFGFVLDRGAIPADRLNAAREVFDFNGYAVSALRPI
ncbi:lipocalin [Tabrizicola sp.]|uniref:lipocalin n=1 Tax=Tabrizicola sp. TaxID=2005166 RepID=UPI00286D11CD|nr:lipocalin [Tabrizicola sp.]